MRGGGNWNKVEERMIKQEEKYKLEKRKKRKGRENKGEETGDNKRKKESNTNLDEKEERKIKWDKN